MNITTNVASLNWRTNTKGTWKALVKDLSPNTAVTFSDSFTGVVTGKQIAVESPTMPTGFITYTTDDTNVVVGGALYGVGTAYDSVEAVTGEKSVKIDSVDMGSLSWLYDSTNVRFYTTDLANVIKKPSSWSPVIAAPYVYTAGLAGTGTKDMMIGCFSTGYIYVVNKAYTDPTEFKIAMSGVYLYYELAIPTTSTETAQSLIFTSGNNTFGGGSFDATYEGTEYSIPLGKNCKYIHRFPDGTEELLTGSTTVTSVDVRGAQDKLINLTHWFGNGREPSINDFYKLYPKWKFYDIPYDSGTILNYKGTGIQTIGFNAYDHSTGTAVLLGGNRYQICGTYTSCSYIDQWGNAETLEIDANGIFLPVNNGTLTVVGGNNTDTCVHLVWSGYKNFGEPEYKYEEYVKNDKSFPIATYFPDGMNGIVDVYDELTSDNVVKRIGSYTFTGQENFKYDNNWQPFNGYYTCVFSNLTPDFKYTGASNLRINWRCPFLQEVTYGEISGKIVGLAMSTNTSYSFFIRVTNSIASNGTEMKAWLAGKTVYYELATPVTTTIPEPLNLSYPVNDFGTEQSLPINTTTLLSTDLNADIKYSQDFTRLLVHYSDMYPTVKTLVEDEPNLMRKDDVAPNATVGNAYNLIDRNAAGIERQFSYDTSGGTQDITDGTAVAKKLMGTTLNLNQLVHDTNENTVNSVDGNATVTDAVEGNVKHLVVSGDTVVVNQLVKENVEKTESGTGRIWIKDAAEGAAKGLKVTVPRSVVVNQLSNSETTDNWLSTRVTSVYSDGFYLITSTGEAAASNYKRYMYRYTLTAGHVYAIHGEIRSFTSTTARIGIKDVTASRNDTILATDTPEQSTAEWKAVSCIGLVDSTYAGHTLRFGVFMANTDIIDAYIECRNMMCVDLTQYFNDNQTLIDSITSWDDLVAYDPSFASYVQYNTGTVKGVTPALTLNGATQPFATTQQEMFGVGDVRDELNVTGGKFSKKISSIDLSTLTWTESSGVWTATISDIKSNTINVLSASYSSVSVNGTDVSITSTVSPTGLLYYELATPVVTDVTPVSVNLLSHDNTIFQTAGDLQSTIEATYDGLNQNITLDPTHTYIVNHQYISDSIITNESSIDCVGTEDNLVDLTQLYNGDSTRISAIHSWASLSSKIHMYRDWLPYIPGEIVNLAATIRVYQHEYAYGVIYDPSQSSPACQKVELHDGVLTEVTSFSSLPAHDFKRCVMDNLSTRHINYYLDPTDSTKKADGTASVLTGADGDVMVEMPITYYKLDEDYNGTGKILWLVSNTPFTGSEIHPYFYVSPNGDTARTQYVGAYRAVGCDENGNALNTTEGAITQTTGTASTRLLRSVAGALPWVSNTLASMRTDAVRHGGTMVNRLFHEYLFLMIIIEQASLNCQSVSLGYSNGKTNALWACRKSGRVNYGNCTGEILANSGTTDDDNFYSLKVNNVQLYRDVARDANNYYAWSNHAATATVYWTASATPANGDTAYSDTEGTSSGYMVASWSTTTDANKIIQFQYRGIENPWGECWEFDDGMQKYQKSVLKSIKVNNVIYYVNHLKDGTGTKTAWTTEDNSATVWTTTVTPSNNTATYSDADCTVSTGYNLTQSSFVRMDCELWSTRVTNDYTSTDQHTTGTKVYDMRVNYWPVGSWIKKFDPRTFLCLVNGGNGSQYLCDNWYNDNGTGSRVVSRGGIAGGGADDGLGYVAVRNGLTVSGVGLSGRLSA